MPANEAVLSVKEKTSAPVPPVRFWMPLKDVDPSSVPALAAVMAQVFAWLGPSGCRCRRPLRVTAVIPFSPTVKEVVAAVSVASCTATLRCPR